MAANQHAWHSTVSATDRYGTIRSIQEALPDGSMSTAMAIEQAAYTDSASLDDYTSTCEAAIAPKARAQPSQDTILETVGDTRIGSYTNCVAVGDGVTSTVYRSSDGTKALKVITAHHPLPPHDPQREVRILQRLRPPCIPLLDSFRDQAQRQVLVFPYKPLTLEALLAAQGDAPLPAAQAGPIFSDVLRALAHLHAQGIIHRDVKPSAVLLDAPRGPAHLADFGTAWHPALAAAAGEPATAKILDVGTGPYRAPDVLLANRAYGAEVDLWALGVVLAECLAAPPRPPFASRGAHEDGNQLGLILSIFKTVGTPTPATWPEAERFQVSPFEMWTVFPQRSWREILPDVDPDWRDVIAATVRYSKRATAEELLQYKCIQ